jgi:hypothetical protein
MTTISKTKNINVDIDKMVDSKRESTEIFNQIMGSLPSNATRRASIVKARIEVYGRTPRRWYKNLAWHNIKNYTNSVKQLERTIDSVVKKENKKIANKEAAVKRRVERKAARKAKKLAPREVGVEIVFDYIKTNSTHIENIKQLLKLSDDYFHPSLTSKSVEKLLADKKFTFHDEIKPIQKVYKIRSMSNTIDSSVENFIKNRFADSLGDPSYFLIYNVSTTTSLKDLPTFSNLTVPLRHGGKNANLLYFDEAGECLVDNIDCDENMCIPTMILEQIVKKHPNRIRNMSLDFICSEIERLWLDWNGFPDLDFDNDFDEDSDAIKLIQDQSMTGESYSVKKHGVSYIQLITFCRKYKINVRFVDLNQSLFYTPQKCNSKQGLCLMGLIHNGHGYNIMSNKKFRKSLSSKGNCSVLKCVLDEANTKKKKVAEKKLNGESSLIVVKEITYDIIHEILKSGDKNINVFTTQKEDLSTLFCQIWKRDNVFYKNKQIVGHMTEIYFENNVTLYQNSEYHSIVSICKELDIPFANQSVISIGMDIINAIKTPTSDLDNYVSYASSQTGDFLDKINKCGWVATYPAIKDEHEHVYKTDINKCYTSIFRDESIIWAIPDITDRLKIFGEYRGRGAPDEPIEENCLYYVETTNNVLFKGNGVYRSDLVSVGLKDKLIYPEDIKYYVRCSRSKNGSLFRKFCDMVYEKVKSTKNRKEIINTFIGLLGKKMKKTGKKTWTTDLNFASTYYFNDHKADVFCVSEKQCGERLFLIDNTSTKDLPANCSLVNAQIVQMGRLRTYEMWKEIGGKLLAVATDSITTGHAHPVDIEYGSDVGQYKKESVTKSRIMGYKPQCYVNKDVFEPLDIYDHDDVKVEDEFDTDKIIDSIYGESVLIDGWAGCGKTYFLNKYIERMESNGVRIEKMVFTNLLKKNIKGSKTLHSGLGFGISGKRSRLIDWKKFDCILIDEVSLMGILFYRELIRIKRNNPNIFFIIAGDFGQLAPVKEENIDFADIDVLKEICTLKLTLTQNKRSTEVKLYNLLKIARNPRNIPDLSGLKKVYTKTILKSNIRKNISYTNATRKFINKTFMLKDKKLLPHIELRLNKKVPKDFAGVSSYAQNMYVYKGLPVLCRKSRMSGFTRYDETDDEMGDGMVYNGQSFTVLSYDEKQITLENTDGTVSIPLRNFIYQFNPMFCQTIHSVQGQTIDEPYVLWNSNMYAKNMLYTALSRTTKHEYLHIGR